VTSVKLTDEEQFILECIAEDIHQEDRRITPNEYIFACRIDGIFGDIDADNILVSLVEKGFITSRFNDYYACIEVAITEKGFSHLEINYQKEEPYQIGEDDELE
jgi:hypothetical protein